MKRFGEASYEICDVLQLWKRSTLALHKMLEQGHEAVCLIVMVNEEVGRSYFHYKN